ncbi:MAG: hypothetical protein ACRDLU_08330 [Gaiellaceae bacterium]
MLVDQHRVAEAGAAVDDTMRDRLDQLAICALELRNLLDALVLVDKAELQARRARVDD